MQTNPAAPTKKSEVGLSFLNLRNISGINFIQFQRACSDWISGRFGSDWYFATAKVATFAMG